MTIENGPPFPDKPPFPGESRHLARVISAHPISTRPDVRAGMESFFAALTDQDVTTALDTVYTQPPPAFNPYAHMSEVLLNETLDPNAQKWERSAFANARGLITELLNMNHPDVWTQLLRVACSDDKVVAGLNKGFGFRSEADIDVLGENISDTNMPLFGRTLINIGLAVVYGTEFQHHLQERWKDNTRYGVGMALGTHFKYSVVNRAETISRLQELFPPNILGQNSIPALSSVQQADAFINYNKPTASGMTVCPGQDITKLLFRGFGNLLVRQDVQQRFINSASQGR